MSLELVIKIIGICIGIVISIILWKTIFNHFPISIKILLTVLIIILSFMDLFI
jgi:hypothetical protein